MLQELESTYLNRINELIQTVQPCPEVLSKASDSLCEVSQMLGCNSYTYVGGKLLAGHKIVGWKPDSRPITITNIDNEFQSIYSDSRLDKHDPILKNCFHTIYPKQWEKIVTHTPITRKEKKFMDLSSDFGMNDGLAFPIHGLGDDYGILSFSSQKKGNMPNSSVLAMTNLFAQKLHTSIREHFDTAQSSESAKLAAREIDILHWCGEGKTAWEIGAILGISVRTVETHIQNAKKKLDAVTVTQAVAKAMTLRFKEPI